MVKNYKYVLSSLVVLFCISCTPSEHEEIDEKHTQSLDIGSSNGLVPFDYLQLEENSVCIIRPLFERSCMSCTQIRDIKQKGKYFDVIYYEFDFEFLFYDNLTMKYVNSTRTKNPKIETSFFKIKKMDLPKSVINPTSGEKIKTPLSESYEYVIYSPLISDKTNHKFRIPCRYPKNNYSSEESKILRWIGEISKRVSFKEDLYFQIFNNQTEARQMFYEKYGKDPDFYKKSDSIDYAIPSSEIELFFSGNIGKSSHLSD
jgi:hypothetical protein